MAKRGSGPNMTVSIDGDATSLARELEKANAKIDRLEGKLGKAGQTANRAGGHMQRAFDPKVLSGFVSGMVGAGGVTWAIGQTQAAWVTYIKTIREAGTEARKAMSEMVAFAALQEGGVKALRVQRATGLATQFGITERGVAFDTVQALQSAAQAARPELTAAEAFEAGMAAARTVFAAEQVGVPLEAGLETEVMGRAKGMPAGEAVRMAYRAGQLSPRSPAVIAGGVQGLAFWQDPAVAFAAASVISGAVKPEQLGTYWGQAGEALAATSSATRWFQRQGLGDEATRLERLQALAAAGVDTAEELQRIGFTERRQRQALLALVPNLGAVEAAIKDIRETAKPGLLAGERRAIEAEIPRSQIARELATLESAYADEMAFGPLGGRGLELEREQRIRALAFRRLGVTSALGYPVVEEGISTRWDTLQFAASKFFEGLASAAGGGRPVGKDQPSFADLGREMQAIRKELESLNKYEADKAAERQRPAPLGVSPHPDR